MVLIPQGQLQLQRRRVWVDRPPSVQLVSNRNNRKKTVTSTRLPQTSGTIHQLVRSELRRYIEPKITHVNFGAQVSANGTIQSLTSNLVQGDGALSNYTGFMVRPEELRVRLSVSTDQSFNTCRFLIFRWKDASDPSPTGILDQVGGGWAPHSAFYWVNRTKIQVLYDNLFALKPRASAGYDNKAFDIKLSLKNGPPIMLPAGTSGAKPQMNGIYALMITDDLVPSTPAYVFRSALTYTDA